MYDNLEWIDLEIARGEGRQAVSQYAPNPYGDTVLGQAFQEGAFEAGRALRNDQDRRRGLRERKVRRA